MNTAVATQPREKMALTSDLGMANRGHGMAVLPTNMNEIMRYADVMANAGLALPKYLRGNIGACIMLINQAIRWEMDPFAVANKSYSVNDRIAYEAQLIAAVVNTRSGIKGRLKYSYDGEGPSLSCTVTGILEGEEFSYTSPTIGEITTKNSPLWKSDPQQQLGYFSARSWARRYVPEVMLGVYDKEESQERGPDNARNVTPVQNSMAARLQAPTQQATDAQEGFNRTNTNDAARDAVTGEIEQPEDDGLFQTDQPEPTSQVEAEDAGLVAASGESDEVEESPSPASIALAALPGPHRDGLLVFATAFYAANNEKDRNDVRADHSETIQPMGEDGLTVAKFITSNIKDRNPDVVAGLFGMSLEAFKEVSE